MYDCNNDGNGFYVMITTETILFDNRVSGTRFQGYDLGAKFRKPHLVIRLPQALV
jgi:hypothetical protein